MSRYKDAAIIILTALLVTVAVTAGATVLNSDQEQTTAAASTEQPSEQPSNQVSLTDVPQDVQMSTDGAKALKRNLSESETFDDTSVMITRDGEVLVHYNSQADNGPELKDEMAEVAFRYAAAKSEHQEMGGLQVRANGVKLLVSSDAASAYGDGKLKNDAFEQTFHWGTYRPSSTE